MGTASAPDVVDVVWPTGAVTAQSSWDRYKGCIDQRMRQTRQVVAKPSKFQETSRSAKAMLDIERVSHVLGRTLRYHAEHLGLHPDRDGFVVVAELLHMPELENLTVTDIQRVVATSVGSRGMRFEIRDHGGDIGMEIRALYKHDSPGRSVLESGGFSRGDSLSRGNTRRSGLHRDDSARTSRNGKLSWPPVVAPGKRPPATLFIRKTSDDNSMQARVPRSSSITREDLGTKEEEEPPPAPPGCPAPGAALPPPPPLRTEPPRSEVWERFTDKDGREWFWNECSQEHFFADDSASGWTQFLAGSGILWWWRSSDGRFFFEE